MRFSTETLSVVFACQRLKMRRIDLGVILMAIAIAFGSQHQLEAQTQVNAQALTNYSHNINNPGPISPFFTQATDANKILRIFDPAAGLSGDLVSGAGNSTNVSGTVTIVGSSNAITNFRDGNGLPRGVTLTYDLSFTISTSDGLLVTAGGNTGNGLAPGALPFDVFNPGESIDFSAATVSNISFTGAPTDPGVTFTPGTVSGVGLSQFRSSNFGEASNGATLSNGTDTVGFGVSMGSIASQVAMNNGFTAAPRFPAMMMDTPITLTMDSGTFNLKGFELTTFLDYEFTSPTAGANVALTVFNHNIGDGSMPDSFFVTQATDADNGTVYNFVPTNGLAGSIVAGSADTTTVSGTIQIVGNATAAANFLDGNNLPEGVTLSYDLSFTINSPDGQLGTAAGNTGDGLGVGATQYEVIDNGEQVIFSPATISNIAFSGTPVDGSGFTPGTVSDVVLVNFRSNNFGEATTGAVLSSGSDSVGFGLATGTLGSNVAINNSFAAATRFPAFSMSNQLTLASDSGSFNLKGFELATIFTYETGSVLKGDVDGNGVVDFFDIQPFINILTSGGFQPQADVDQDGDVDFFDIQPFISLLTNLAA